MKQTVSLLISTYNWKEALSMTLHSVFDQTVLPKEIIIADDGSREDTARVIDELREQSPVPVVHVWHQDIGFRLCTIRNKAIARTTGEYIVQIDGDIILDRHFIADHLELAEKEHFICGSRVLLSPEVSKKILENRKLYSGSFKLNFNALRSRQLRNYLADRFARNNLMRLRGCNMSFWKEDLIRINGYNEQLTSWGHEDAELAYRLLFAGVKKRYLKMGGVAYHLYHKNASTHEEQAHYNMIERVKESGKYWTEDGLNKYLK